MCKSEIHVELLLNHWCAYRVSTSDGDGIRVGKAHRRSGWLPASTSWSSCIERLHGLQLSIGRWQTRAECTRAFQDLHSRRNARLLPLSAAVITTAVRRNLHYA